MEDEQTGGPAAPGIQLLQTQSETGVDFRIKAKAQSTDLLLILTVL